ncbi:MAG: HpcH/HpaI aldolase/citrate lyase family protein [Thiofilum sp.]|uniref:HpcH/HpaI aldolase/citrate lyase family protein n=1 Tax=Thiofilum sp. TaxID=2212733 RepID=UPI0025E0D360|nr:HpcH/HpaI aldolase/citrate lyase family protein [Thiofilum sp.]MBK8454307.1 HpcH/HpaI aldolase/citrate lyase family protein [Thiofilum sp.]
MNPISPYQLGATLYVPATRHDLIDIILHNKIHDLRSMVICLEDAIKEHELQAAFHNITHCLEQWAYANLAPDKRPLVFIRPRYSAMITQLLDLPHIDLIDGLVLPKFDQYTLHTWSTVLDFAPEHWVYMPTLETKALLDAVQVHQLREILHDHPLRAKILVLRIGGNDLLSCLKLRHSRAHTLYDGPLGYVVAMLVSQFIPHDFYLTAPVFDCFSNQDLLQVEIQRDLLHGLVGKTVIHPRQIPIIHQALQVDAQDFITAQRILDHSMPAVFQFEGAMCEPSTHQRWAKEIVERARYFGCSAQA